MDKTLQLTLKINADTSGLNQALAGVGAGVKRVKVPVEINAGDLNGTGEKIGVAFQSEAAKARVGLRTDQAGEIGSIIAKSVVKGVEDSLKDAGRNIGRGNLIGALGNIVATPFKIAGNVASTVIGGALSSTRIAATSAIQGLVNGIGIEVTKGVSAGLREGVEQKLASTFGSTEVIGRTAASQLLEQLGKAAQGIENRVSSAESPFRGIATVIKSEFQKLVETAFDPQEVLAVSRAAQRQARQQRGQVEAEAAEELRQERQKELRQYQDFRERAVRLRAATQAAQSEFEDKMLLKQVELQKVLAGADQEPTLQTAQQRIAALGPRLETATTEREALEVQGVKASKEQLPELRQRALALDTEITSIVAEVNALSKQKETAKPENVGAKLKSLALEISEGVKSLQSIDEDRQKILDKFKDSKGTAREELKKLFEDYTSRANNEKSRIEALQAEQQRLKTKSSEPATSAYAALADQIDERNAKIAKIVAEQDTLFEQFKANPNAADAPAIKQRALALEKEKQPIADEVKALVEQRKTLPSFAQRVALLAAELDEVNAKRSSIVDEAKANPQSKTPEKTKEFDRLTEQAKSLEAQIQQIRAEKDSALQQLETITKEQAKLDQTAEDITRTERQLAERYKKAASNERTLGTNEERRREVTTQLVETLEAAQATKTQQEAIATQRKKGIEVGKKAALQAQKAYEAGNEQEFLDLGAEADLAAKIIEQLEQQFEELGQTRKDLEAKAQKLRARLKEIPEGLPEAVKQAYLDLAGKIPEGDQIPGIRERSTETLGTANAAYFNKENVIGFRPETLAAIKTGQKLTEDQLKELYEEVAHSLQFDFGKLEENNYRNLASEPTTEQVKTLLPELDRYTPDKRTFELDAKIVRDEKVAVALLRQELQELTESVGKDGTELYKFASERLGAARKNIVEQSKSDSVDPQLYQSQIDHFKEVAKFSTETSAEFARFSVENFAPERLQGLVSDVKKMLHYLDALDQEITEAAARQKVITPTAEPIEQAGALAVAKEKVSDLGGIVQRVGGVLAPIGGVAEGTVHALALVGKAGLALADKFGFAAASLIPGGALAYGPAKAVVKNVVGPLAVAGAASQVPGVGEVLGVLQQAIGAIIAPETVGLANGVSHAVTAELHSALPTLFRTLSQGLAESGLPGAELSAQAVNSIGGLLIHTLEPVVSGVASAADATIATVGGAAQELLSQLAAALVAGKVVQEGAKLATSEGARAGALKGIETIGSGLGQVVGGVQDGIQDAQDAIDRTKRAVQQNIEGIKGAAERVAQGDIRAVGDAVEETQAAVDNLRRGVQDVAKASTGAVQDVVEGTAKVVGVFGDLRSVKLPDGLNLVDLVQEELVQIQRKLHHKLKETLEAEAVGVPVVGGSAFVRRDLELVGQVLEAKYEVIIDLVNDQVQKQIEAAPIDLPVKIAPLPELEPLVVQPALPPQAKAQTVDSPVRSTTSARQEPEEPSPIELAQEQLKAPEETQPPSIKELFAAIDGAIDETDNEIKAVYAHFAEVVAATKIAIKKGDVQAIARNTSEAKRVAAELGTQISTLRAEITDSLSLLEQQGLDIGPSSPIGERLRKTKSALGQKAALIPQRLADIGVRPDAADEITQEIDRGVSAQINPALAGIAEGLNQKAAQLKAALSNLVEAAKTNPKVASTAKDLAVIGTGIAASTAVSDHGQIASLAAELIATITARGALTVGGGAEGDLIGALQRLTAKLNDPATQKQLGNSLFSDILGFATSHVTDAVTGIPGSGAVAANTIVPKLQQLRGQAVPVDELDLQPVANKNTQIESVLDELQQIAAAAEKVDATVGDRIALFFLSLKKAYAKAPAPEASKGIKEALNVLEGTLAESSGKIGTEAEQAIAESERSLAQSKKQADKIEQQIAEAERLSGRAEVVVGGKELGRKETGEEFDARLAAAIAPKSEIDKRTQQQFEVLESQQQQQIAEIDQLIAQEQARLAEVRRLATEEQRLKIGAIDQQIAENLQQLEAVKGRAQTALNKTKDPSELIATAAAEQRSPQEETLARIAQAAQQSKTNPALDSIAQAAAQAKSNSNGALDAIAKAVEQGRQDREQVNQRLAAVAAGVGQLPSNTGDSFTPLIAPQQPFSPEEKLKLRRQEASAQQASAQQAQQVAEEAIKSVDFVQVMNGLEAIAVATQQQQQAVDTVDAQLERAAAEGRAKAERLTQHLAQLSQKAPEVSPSRPAESVDERLSRAAQEGNQRENSTTERLARANQLGSSQSDSLTEGLAAAARDGAQQRNAVSGQLEQAALEAKQAINTVDNQLEQAAAAGKAKADALSQRLARLGQKQPEALPSQPAESVNDRLSRAADEGSRKVDPVAARLAKAAQDGAQQRDAVSGQLEQAALEANQIAQKEQKSFGALISANTEIIRAAENAAKQAQQASNEALHGLLAVEDAKAAQIQANAQLKELYAQRDPIYDAPAPSLESDRLAELRKQREQTSRPIQDFQAEDLSQYAVPRQTFNPTGAERGLVAQQRIERDASDRQINDTLRRGKAPTGSPEEIQILGDSAIASFEKNFAKFNDTAEQVEGGSTRTQKALRTVGESVSTFKQKLADNGGVSGVLGKIGQSLSNVAEKAGLPVGVMGKLGNIIKGVGIAALAYVGVTQLGDALVQLGQKAFESYSKVELLQKRLKFVGGGDSALQEDLAFIRKESERLKIPVDQLTESFAALRIATKGTTLEGGKTKEFATALGTLSRVYGLTSEQAQSVQYQLGQTIRLGRAQGDELRSISDAGINITGALAESLGKSGAEIADLLEKGQISADQTVNALIRLGEQAKSGLPDALTAASVSVDSLKKEFVDVALVVGEKTAPLVVAGVSAIGAGIKLLEQTGQKLSPVFDAIGNRVGLLLDIFSPIVGVIGAIAGAIGGDLLDGITIPFQAINAGLIEIRSGFAAVAGVAVQALSAIGTQAAALGVNIPFLAEIIKYANPATIAVRLLGAAIGVFLVGQMIRTGVAIGGVVIPALVSMAGTMTATVIPAIGAAVTASLAFIATPLGATIAAIGIVAAIAAPHMGELANAISGLGDAQVKSNDRATQFNIDYQKALTQLQKGIPLTTEELKKLGEGFAQNIKEGKDTAETADILAANLDRMQASAEAAAQIQAKLTKAMADATKAIKNQSQAIDAGYSTRLAGLNESLANQQITRERFDQEELAAQEEKSGKYLDLYKTQGDNLRAALSEANARLAAPLPDATRTEVKKQVEQLQDQIYEIEQKGGEQRIALAQGRVKVTENIEKDRAKRAENEVKVLENLLAAGSTAQVEIEHDISKNKQQETERRIKEIDRQIKTEVGAAGKLSEIAKNLYSERAVLESELSKIVSEEATKRYDILLKNLEKSRDKVVVTISEAETAANIELQNAQNAGLLKQAQVEAKRTDLTRDRLQKELTLELINVQELQDLPSPTDPEKAEEHQKRIRDSKLKTAQITQQIAENEYKRQESIRKLATDALDQQVKGAQNAATQIEGISQAIQAASQLATNSLERQNKLLEAQKGLHASISGLVDEEYKILAELTTDEERKAQIQQNAANYRLKSLREAQALERQVLEIQQDQEKVQGRIAIIKAQANTLKAQAEVAKAQVEEKKVLLNPESTDADKQAARLGVQSAQVGVFASQVELQSLIDADGQREQLASIKRRTLGADQQKATLAAKLEYAKTITDPDKKEEYLNRIYSKARQGIQDAPVLPIGNRRTAPPPDYTQLDSASQQLGLTPKGVNLGRFIPPTPVDLHSGLNVQSLQVDSLGADLKELRLLTQNGVAANLVTLVQQNQALATQLLTLANRPRVENNNYVQPPKRSSVLAGSTL